jgi:hypothetical protein
MSLTLRFGLYARLVGYPYRFGFLRQLRAPFRRRFGVDGGCSTLFRVVGKAHLADVGFPGRIE